MTDPHDLELELERDPLVAVHLALAELVDAGRPVDADRLRGLITAATDQAVAHAADAAFSDRSRAAATRWAEIYTDLLPAVTALEAGDADTARQTIRSAMFPDDPDPFAEALAILRRHRDGERLDAGALRHLLAELADSELDRLLTIHRDDLGDER